MGSQLPLTAGQKPFQEELGESLGCLRSRQPTVIPEPGDHPVLYAQQGEGRQYWIDAAKLAGVNALLDQAPPELIDAVAPGDMARAELGVQPAVLEQQHRGQVAVFIQPEGVGFEGQAQLDCRGKVGLDDSRDVGCQAIEGGIENLEQDLLLALDVVVQAGLLEVDGPLPNTGSAYWKLQRRLALDLPILGVSVLLSLDKGTVSCSDMLCTTSPISSILHTMEKDELTCKEIRIALGVAAPTPIRALKAENLMRGKKITDELLEEVANTASVEAQPRDSIRGEAWYRQDLIRVLVKRMAMKSIERVVRPEETMFPERLW